MQIEDRMYQQRIDHPELAHGVVVRVMRRGEDQPDVYVLRENQLWGETVTGGATHQGAVELYLNDLDPRLPQAIAVSVPYEAILKEIDEITRMQAQCDLMLLHQPPISFYGE